MFRSMSLVGTRRHRRPLAAVVAALALAVTVAACDEPTAENPPYWLPGTTVDATVFGPLVHIAWDATQGGDPVGSYQISLGTYSGTVVALVPASVRSCYISGLAASTSYTIVVTARDAQQHWSGPLSGTKGNRTTSIATTSHAGTQGLWCHAGTGTDDDADGLPDAFETDDGSWNSVGDTGTDPADPDTDDDGISDGIEALGRPGLNLIAMGASPVHKDLLIETDWIAGAPCATQPTVAKLAPMTTAFASAPVANPDGDPGINLIVDHGQGGLFTGGTQVPDIEGPVDGIFPSDLRNTPFPTTKANHFAPVREGIFHYSTIHSGVGQSSKGEIGGDDTYVSGHCGDSDPLAFPGTLMHEIGHNLGLSHGGTKAGIPGGYQGTYFCDGPSDSHCISKSQINGKPNYVSIMNYVYGNGVDDTCEWGGANGPKRLDYSTGWRPPMDENAVDEAVGICRVDTNGDGIGDGPLLPVDFDVDGSIDTTPYRKDLNGDGYITPMHDHDDWGHIEASGLTEIHDGD